MILKGSQRGGAKQLALHLLKTEENEQVELHEIKGFVSDDLIGALKEAQAVSLGTRCKQFMFSVSLNPPETESVGIDAFEEAIARIEERIGLAGQPRVIVFHEKEGRRHAHCVWSRIDAEQMKAVNLSHFKLKLRDISRTLYLDHEWRMPRGLMNSAARDPRNFTLGEWQQAKRMGWHAGDLKSLIQECWAVSDSRAAFEQALSERGMTLARGDRRGHVVLTHEGEVLSVARYIGKRAKDVRAKLGEPDRLPSLAEAKVRLGDDIKKSVRRLMAEAMAQKLEALVPLEERRRVLTDQHRRERARMDEGQRQRWGYERAIRSARLDTGLKGLWQRLTGQHAHIRTQNERAAYLAFRRDRLQRQALIDHQLMDRQELQAEFRQIREQHVAVLTDLRQDRKHFNEIAQVEEPMRARRTRRPTPPRSPKRDNTPDLDM